MPATPSRIGFVMQPVRRATVSDAALLARHGTLARRDTEPQETYFDDVDDAEVMAQARLDLLGTERRRFSVVVRGLDEALALETAGPDVPQGRYVDDVRKITRDVLIAEIGFDFATQRATLVPWG